MKSSLLILAALVAVLAACGSEDGAPPSEEGAEAGHEAVVGGPAVAPDESATLVGEFITSEGEHVVDSAGKFEIHVVRENGLLKYRVQIRKPSAQPSAPDGAAASEGEHVTTTGQKLAAIDPNASWFIYVELEERYWVFDGASRLALYEYHEQPGDPRRSEVRMTDFKSAPDRLEAEMPTCVKDRIPADALAAPR